MKRVAVTLLVSILCGSALANDLVTDALVRCYSTNASQLDDGRSDARSIASALLHVCIDRRLDYVQDLIKQLDPLASRAKLSQLAAGRRELDLDWATAIVLVNRKKN